MDLLDFDTTELYFEEELAPQVVAAIDTASKDYANGQAELPLLRAYLLAHHSLTVLVALYRFYFYQHRLEDAQHIAALARTESSSRLGIPDDLSALAIADLPTNAELKGLVRFYLLVIKGEAVMRLRTLRLAEATEQLEALVQLDPQDRLGTKDLLKIAKTRQAEMDAEARGVPFIGC